MGLREPSLNKLTRPASASVLPRERLFSRIDEALSRPVLWVTSPGGSGKTTLIASYLESRALPCLWYQVDQGDGDAATFFYFMGMAAGKAAPRAGKSLPLLTREYLAALPAFSRRYFESLFTSLPRPSALVFDNCQDVRGTMFHDILYEGLAAVPEGISIIIISRESPPARFARLLANGRIGLLEWEQVRFTPEESSDFIRMMGGEGLAEETITCLYRKTEGWVAGLRLILEQAKVYGFELEGDESTPEEIFHYFATEVFTRMDRERREFLLISSFLPYMPVPLTGKLTGNGSAGRLLSELTRNHYFTARRSSREVVYQYHQLFREFLLSMAEETLGPREAARTRSRAATLLEEWGGYAEAVELYDESGDWEAATRLILRQAPNLLAQGRSETLRGWLDALPPAMIDERADLLYWHAASLEALNPVECLNRYRKAFALYRESGTRDGMFLAWSAAADVAFYLGAYAVQRDWYGVLGELLADDPSYPNGEIETRVTMSTFNVMAFTMTDHPDIGKWHERAYTLVLNDKTVEINRRLMTGVHLWVYYGWIGDFARAAVLEDFLDTMSGQERVSDLVKLVIMTDRVLYCFLKARCEEGLRIAEDAIRFVEKTGIRAFSVHVMGQAVSCALSIGDVSAANRLLEQMKSRIDTQISIDAVLYHAGVAWKAALDGDLAAALQHTRISTELCKEAGFLAIEGIGFSALAEFLWETGEEAEARSMLDAGYERAERIGSSILRFFCLLIDARISFDKGEDGAGIGFLAEAFGLARANGYVNKYMWRPKVMADLCSRALEAGIETEYARKLIRLRDLVVYPPAAAIEAWPWPVKVYTLGRFELHVNGEPVRFNGKVQKKPLEMLKAMLASGCTETREGRIACMLWPESDGDTVRNSVKVTLHRLRELFGCEGAVQVRDGMLCLDRRRVWVDIWAFDELLEAAQVKADRGEEAAAVRLTEKALALYQGHFLPDEGDSSWPTSCRKRLKSRFILHTVALSNLLQSMGARQRAVACCLRGLEVDDLAEELYQNLMEYYLETGLCGEAIAVYQRCRLALAAHGAQPSAKTRTIIRDIREA